MKNIAYSFLSIFFFISCANPKKIYTKSVLDNENGVVNKILQVAKAETSDKSVIVFTSWFEKDTIVIFNGEEEVLNRVIETSPETGFSTFKGVSNELPVKIRILSSKPFEIKLSQIDLKKYKFVYIKRDSQKRDKYILEYSNQWKKFM